MMDALSWLSLLLLVLPSLAVVREFVLVEQPMSWSDAQSYCREHHLDLGTVANEDNWARVLALVSADKSTTDPKLLSSGEKLRRSVNSIPIESGSLDSSTSTSEVVFTDSIITDESVSSSEVVFTDSIITDESVSSSDISSGSVVSTTTNLGSVGSTSEAAWIGLYSNLSSWRWSLDNSLLYQDGNTNLGGWFTFSPENNGGNAFCVYMMNSVLVDSGCDIVRYSICYDEPTNTYHPLLETHNWYTAQEICREKHTDLASVRNQEELDAINAAISHSRSAFWVGLSRDGWMWSNQRTSSFTAWAPSRPRSGLQGCVYADASGWTNDYCTTERPFICSTAATRVIKVVIKAKGPIDPNDPQILASILKQKETLLREHGIGQEVKLKWREGPKGVVFNKTEL